mgnify:FL=1
MSTEDEKYPLGRRITVNGKGGKTTLSKALAKRFALEFIEQDAIRHQANWVELTNDEHIVAALERFKTAPNGWISDGNYSALREAVVAESDTVIVLALPWRVMVWRTFKRTFWRGISRKELWNGNRENLFLTFFTRNSVLYDLWHRRERYRSFAETAIADTPTNVRLVIIRTARELDDFYEEHGLARE